jgi:hypothetical protein
MKSMKIIFPILAMILVSCGHARYVSEKTFQGVDTVIIFPNHIKLFGTHSHDLGGTSFNPIVVLFDNKRVFKDSLNEYWLKGYESVQYPKFLECTDGKSQLLIEVDERPNSNELACFTVTENGMVQINRLPLFYWNPSDMDNDNRLEVDGFLTNGETTADGDTAFYNPMLVYEITNNCLSLDSPATIEKNRKIWGQFHGYNYNDTLLLPFNRKEW